MKRPSQPENKFFLSNNSIFEENIENSLEFFNNGYWTINYLDDKKPIRSLSLGDYIEYVDSELSFEYLKQEFVEGSVSPENEPRRFIKTVTAKVIEIKINEISLQKENSSRYVMGHLSKFVNYKSNYQNNVVTENAITEDSISQTSFIRKILNKNPTLLWILSIALLIIAALAYTVLS